ncbi:MAG TPA: tetratricopeptide repeat protein [Steroidobacteraceae bacterium]
MTELPLLTWILVVAALVLGILAGHFGWGKRWPASFSKLHPDYLTGLDYLVTEQPDRALDMFLKLMDANADTIETHFALGTLYRRRGEVERAIRIHQNLLARQALAPEHREQALLALAQDYLRAGLLDRAEGLFQQVSEVARLRASALDALLSELVTQAESRDFSELKRLVFAAVAADLVDAAPLRGAIEKVLLQDPTLQAMWRAAPEQYSRTAHEIGALLAHAEKYRCSECGFSGRHFYWHCPACHSWDSFEAYAIVKLR